MKLHRCIALIATLFLLAGCEQWRQNDYPARNSPDQSGVNDSQWSSGGDSPSTQPGTQPGTQPSGS